MNKELIIHKNWSISRDGETIVLTLSKRAGNDEQKIEMSYNEFAFLYQIVNAFGQLE